VKVILALMLVVSMACSVFGSSYELEPNGSQDNATEVLSGQTFNANSFKSDVDYFALNATANDIITSQINRTASDIENWFYFSIIQNNNTLYSSQFIKRPNESNSTRPFKTRVRSTGQVFLKLESDGFCDYSVTMEIE